MSEDEKLKLYNDIVKRNPELFHEIPQQKTSAENLYAAKIKEEKSKLEKLNSQLDLLRKLKVPTQEGFVMSDQMMNQMDRHMDSNEAQWNEYQGLKAENDQLRNRVRELEDAIKKHFLTVGGSHYSKRDQILYAILEPKDPMPDRGE